MLSWCPEVPTPWGRGPHRGDDRAEIECSPRMLKVRWEGVRGEIRYWKEVSQEKLRKVLFHVVENKLGEVILPRHNH